MQWIIWPMPEGWLHLKSIANWFPSETIDHSIVQKSYQCSGLRIFGNCKICVILSPTRIQSWLWKFCQSVQDCPSQQVARVFSLDVFPFSIKTLPKAQRTRGLSSAYQSNFFRSYHKLLHKSWSNIFRISTKHKLQNLNQTSAFQHNLNLDQT